MNLTTDVTTARANKKRSVGLRRASSLLGGALLGTSIVTPILAGGDAVDGDAFVILLSGLLALAGIVVHVAGSGGTAHARATASMSSMLAPVHSQTARVSRDSGADARMLV
jgi:hypothetical protein